MATIPELQKAINEKASFESIKTGVTGELQELSLSMRLAISSDFIISSYI